MPGERALGRVQPRARAGGTQLGALVNRGRGRRDAGRGAACNRAGAPRHAHRAAHLIHAGAVVGRLLLARHGCLRRVWGAV